MSRLTDHGIYSVLDYGAKGDGQTDDSAAVQNAIDDANANGGGIVYLDPKQYRGNVTLKANVQLMGSAALPNPSGSSGTVLWAYSAGPVIDTPGSSAHGMAVKGIALKGLGASTACTGIRIRTGSWRMLVKECTFNNFSDQAILMDSGSIACAVEDVIAINCLLDRTQSAKVGVIDAAGTDHFFRRCEVTASLSALSDSNAYLCAFVIRGANNFLADCIGEISDVGFHFIGSAGGAPCFYNRLSNCRADLNFGHGYEIYCHQNSFAACHATRNSQETDNTYSGFYFGTTWGHSNTLAGCLSGSISSDTKKQKYGFEDNISTVAQYNQFFGVRGLNNGTGLFNRNPFPTSDPGVVGHVWSNSGVLTVST